MTQSDLRYRDRVLFFDRYFAAVPLHLRASPPPLLLYCTVYYAHLVKFPPQRNLIALFRSCCVLSRSGSCRSISAACCSISATLTQPQLWQTGDLLSPLRTSPTYHVPRCTGRAYVAMLLCSCSQFPSVRSLSQSVHSSFSPYVPMLEQEESSSAGHSSL